MSTLREVAEWIAFAVLCIGIVLVLGLENVR